MRELTVLRKKMFFGVVFIFFFVYIVVPLNLYFLFSCTVFQLDIFLGSQRVIWPSIVTCFTTVSST